MSIKLYYNPMSSAARIRLSLEELGVPFETVLVDLQANEQKQPEFLALNPNGKVPTIVLDGQPMFESIAIQIALGERYGVERGLWPALGSPEQLQALTWLCWGQVELASALFRYLVNSDPNRPAEERHAAVAEAARVDARRLLRILDARIGQRGNIVGERWTLVDADLSSVLGWALWMGKIDISDERHLGAWLERAQARPAHRALMAETSG
jgi:glutathione S-transferase